MLYVDLRQDMLSLQMLRIMDNLWQAEGLDLRQVFCGICCFIVWKILEFSHYCVMMIWESGKACTWTDHAVEMCSEINS